MVWLRQFAEELPFTGGCAVAIGNFDGVHAGHCDVVASLHGGLPRVVLTFDPHPRVVLFPDVPLRTLMTLDEKVAALGKVGADGVAVLRFDRVVAEWEPRAFIDQVLVGWLRAQVVAVGENFRFGKGAKGDVETLRADGRFAVRVVPLVRDAGGVLSSRRLREALP